MGISKSDFMILFPKVPGYLYSQPACVFSNLIVHYDLTKKKIKLILISHNSYTLHLMQDKRKGAFKV